jgi:hypothetical protein
MMNAFPRQEHARKSWTETRDAAEPVFEEVVIEVS